MGFVSFAGRVLFASVFLLSAYQEFIEYGSDGGPAAKALRPKFNQVTRHVTTHLGLVAPHIDMKHVIAATIALKGLGGLLFIFSSTFGAYLLQWWNQGASLPGIHHTYCLRLLQLRHREGRIRAAFHQVHTEFGSVRLAAVLPGNEERDP